MSCIDVFNTLDWHDVDLEQNVASVHRWFEPESRVVNLIYQVCKISYSFVSCDFLTRLNCDFF